AFGFLTATPPALTVNGSQLAVNSGQTFALVGGPVTINKGAILTAPAGTIHVTSAAGVGEVPVDPTNVSALTVATLGSVSLAGNISASGGALVDVCSASCTNVGVPSGPAGRLTVTTGNLTLTSDAIFASFAQGSGSTGPISITAGSIVVDGSAPSGVSQLT